MYDHEKESKTGHQEKQPRDRTTNDQDRVITLLGKQARYIHHQDNII